ncbi:class I SAM-dependent methyltransferase [Streptomyces sp. NPDC002514]|uniref:class I SAM-dependent methyltransferase n=1 Tax=Streptomyces sp. NPDC001270 TaxID=3364554 RepID=UPI00368C341D
MALIGVGHWDQVFAAGTGFRPADPVEMRLVADHAQPRRGQRALDVGCGLGGYAAQLTGLGYDTLAVDWAESSVAAVRDRYAGLLPGLHTLHLDFEDDQAVEAALPVGTFDLVTMRLVYAFMADQSAAAERVRRLLTPEGVCLVTTPLAERLPRERRHIGLTEEGVGALTGGWGSGCWYDLEPGGLRCFVLRPHPVCAGSAWPASR